MNDPLPRGTANAWRGTLVAGLGVAVVVTGLLEALRRTVNDVDAAVDRVWAAGQGVARNTQTTHLLTGTRKGGAKLVDELERHRAAQNGEAA